MEHYFTDQKSPYNPFLIPITLKFASFTLYSAQGIFSAKELDTGTKVLIEHMNIEKNTKVLDLGCGYGVVGIALLKKFPDAKVTFIDSNPRAILLTKKNLKKEGLLGDVRKSDCFSAVSEKFDTILTNPPYSAGRATCINFIKEAYTHLHQKGTLQLVCRRRKGGDVLESVMKDVFGNVKVLGSKSGFRVYCSEFSEKI